MAHAAPRYKLMALAPPAWLARSVAPWQIVDAQLWHDGELALRLRSAKASVPVALDLREGQLVMTLLDERIDRQRASNFVRALSSRLSSRPELRPYLRGLSELALLTGEARKEQPEAAERLAAGLPESLRASLELFMATPARERGPEAQVPELSAEAWALELGPEAEAARVLYRLARGQVIEALEAWSALAPLELEGAPFVRVHLELVGLALLGRRREVLELLGQLEARGDELEPAAWQVIARVYEGLPAKQAAIAAHAQLVARRGDPWDNLRLARVRGDFEPGEPIPRPSTDVPQSSRISFIREVIKILDAAGRLDDLLALLSEVLDSGDFEQLPLEFSLRAATLHLWRGELEPARARAAAVREHGEQRGRVELIEGACSVLAGEAEAALASLEIAQAKGCEEQSWLMWQAEALYALGRLKEARAQVDTHILGANTLVGYLMMLRLCAQTMPAEEMHRSLATGTFLDGLVRDALPQICDPDQLAAALEQPAGFVELVTQLFVRMGGNRTEHPTWLVPSEEPGAPERLEAIVLPPTGREAAVNNLVRIRSEPPEAVLEGFVPLLADYPRSPFPCTYRGELLIWQGRYRDALASFAEADTRGQTRWSYVGRAAAYDLLEDGERAEHWGRLGAEKFGELETATTHVYRGERLRKAGEWARAREDLEIALRAKPRRIGARMNLALLCHATGDEQGWAREIERLERDAPAYLFDAGVRSDSPVTPASLEACLARMVGNRSSFLHTLIDDQGELRVVPSPGQWIGHARLCLSLHRDSLGSELVERWLAARA